MQCHNYWVPQSITVKNLTTNCSGATVHIKRRDSFTLYKQCTTFLTLSKWLGLSKLLISRHFTLCIVAHPHKSSLISFAISLDFTFIASSKSSWPPHSMNLIFIAIRNLPRLHFHLNRSKNSSSIKGHLSSLPHPSINVTLPIVSTPPPLHINPNSSPASSAHYPSALSKLRHLCWNSI